MDPSLDLEPTVPDSMGTEGALAEWMNERRVRTTDTLPCPSVHPTGNMSPTDTQTGTTNTIFFYLLIHFFKIKIVCS